MDVRSCAPRGTRHGRSSSRSPPEHPAREVASLGLVLGPEAPLIALGLGIGALAVDTIRLEGTDAHLLVLAGAFAALAVLFGGPLVAEVSEDTAGVLIPGSAQAVILNGTARTTDDEGFEHGGLPT
jgi:hypothetical protein